MIEFNDVPATLNTNGTIDWNRAASADGDAELLEAELRDRVRIEPTVLDEEFIRTPADIARVAKLHADAIGLERRAKAKAKRIWGMLLIKVYHEAELAGLKKPTVGEAEAAVEQMEVWQQVQEEEIEADVRREWLKGTLTAVMCKRDMVVQLGANSRAEMERDPVVRDRARASRGGGW